MVSGSCPPDGTKRWLTFNLSYRHWLGKQRHGRWKSPPTQCLDYFTTRSCRCQWTSCYLRQPCRTRTWSFRTDKRYLILGKQFCSRTTRGISDTSRKRSPGKHSSGNRYGTFGKRSPLVAFPSWSSDWRIWWTYQTLSGLKAYPHTFIAGGLSNKEKRRAQSSNLNLELCTLSIYHHK